MPSRSELPGSIKRKKFIKALMRLDFVINTVGGKGNHYKVECPRGGKIVICSVGFKKRCAILHS